MFQRGATLLLRATYHARDGSPARQIGVRSVAFARRHARFDVLSVAAHAVAARPAAVIPNRILPLCRAASHVSAARYFSAARGTKCCPPWCDDRRAFIRR